MRKTVTLRHALSDTALLAGALPGESWSAWRILLIAAMGEALTDDERAIFTKLTDREKEPGEMVEVLLVVAGRRSGKTKAMSVLSVYLSTLCDWSDDLSLGERGVALFMAPTERQAVVAHRFSAELVDSVELLRSTVESRANSTLALKRGIDLETQPASWRHSRGFTSICVALDECAFLRTGDDAANPDTEIVAALKPSLATTSGPMLLTSSPSHMDGIVYRLWKKHYGAAGDPRCLVVHADSRSLNPSLRQSVIDRAYEDDPVGAAAEYGAEWREPFSAYLSREQVERCVERGISLRARLPGIQYVCFVDPASGTGTDSFAACIAHKARDKDRDVIVIDALFEVVPPFDAFTTVAWFAKQLRAWGIREVWGDNWAGGFPVSVFARVGISYMTCPLSASELYLHALPSFGGGMVALLDVGRGVEQLIGLRRRIGQGGHETIVHQGRAHDDVANCIVGAIWKLTPIEMAPIAAYPMLVTRDNLGEPVLVEGQRSIHGPGAPLKGPMEAWRPFVGGRGVGWRRFDNTG